MTTAGRPTWNTAKGGRGKWEGDLTAMSKQYSVRDLPSHTKLKYRQEGQGRPEELQGKDFKRELEEKERLAALEKSKKGGFHSQAALATSGDKRAIVDSTSRSSVTDGASTSKRSRPELSVSAIASVSTANLDADDPWEEDYTEDATDSKTVDPDLDKDEDGREDEDDEDEDEDEEALLAELAKIKRERAEEAARLAAERKAMEETIRMENILKGNPLLNVTKTPAEFKVKRRWDDDVVFKNCARGEVDHAKRGFVNDTLRSEFHKKFMRKYIQ
ncbi:unnamed protein product [Schistocephalus solidus]|uniref:Protein CWC15 homolog A n=1 Tax=Schistocephalus solidus TaxID=70667 RepID=A0A183STJ7_SCHSO|nr:unnamed protein product [Schistocephalus solidus]